MSVYARLPARRGKSVELGRACIKFARARNDVQIDGRNILVLVASCRTTSGPESLGPRDCRAPERRTTAVGLAGGESLDRRGFAGGRRGGAAGSRFDGLARGGLPEPGARNAARAAGARDAEPAPRAEVHRRAPGAAAKPPRGGPGGYTARRPP